MTNVAIVGYGNIGRGVYTALGKTSDMKLEGIMTRRPRDLLSSRETGSVPIYDTYDQEAILFLKDKIDVAILCGGSRKDLPEQGPLFARYFNTVDSFDTHAHIGPYIDETTQRQMKGYLKEIDDTAKKSKHTSAISIGWDPGTFSIERTIATACFPVSKAYAFYGLTERGGLSMGHSDAIRKVQGVLDARQYTHAIKEAIERVRRGENPDLKAGDMHWRECFVVVKESEDIERIRKEIITEPNYFAPYKTVVNFVSMEELKKNHSSMPHDGLVIAVGETSPGTRFMTEYKCQWDSNPEATGHIMVAFARAVHRLNMEKKFGALRPVDISPAYIHPYSYEDLTKLI